MAAKDGKRPLVFHLKTGPRLTSPPIIAFEFTLVVATGVDPLDGLGGKVSRPGRLVFHSRHARRDIFRHLLRTRLGFGCLLPRLPSLELPLWVFFVEGDVKSLLQDLRHMLLSILDAMTSASRSNFSLKLRSAENLKLNTVGRAGCSMLGELGDS